MSNYKNPERWIDFGGQRTIIPENGVLKVLVDSTNNNADVDSMSELIANVNYAVTTGKKFRLLGVGILTTTAAASTITIHHGVTEDAQTVLRATMRICPAADYYQEYAVDIEFPSIVFVTIDPSTTNVEWLYMVGYEF